MLAVRSLSEPSAIKISEALSQETAEREYRDMYPRGDVVEEKHHRHEHNAAGKRHDGVAPVSPAVKVPDAERRAPVEQRHEIIIDVRAADSHCRERQCDVNSEHEDNIYKRFSNALGQIRFHGGSFQLTFSAFLQRRGRA